jgi:hypothetical protein
MDFKIRILNLFKSMKQDIKLNDNIALVSLYLKLGKPLIETKLTNAEIEEALTFIKAESQIEIEEDFI